jgi:diguanylate cyclase (GGDEF)-like protein/PAS domain S-box-containing protein
MTSGEGNLKEGDETTKGDDAKPGPSARSVDYRLLSVAMETAANAIFVTNRGGRIEFVNPAFERLSGYSKEEAVGRTPRILKSGRQEESFYQDFWQTILAGRAWSGRVVNRRKDGQLFTVTQTVTPIADEQGHVTHFVAIHEDVTAQVEAEERVFHMARHDFLTDLPNRYALADRLRHQAHMAARNGRLLAVLILDLDHFKGVNDSFGHSTGDALLVEVARRLVRNIREVDLLARLGGDEFAVVQADPESPDRVAELAGRLISCLAPPFELENQKVYSGASIGIAISPPAEPDPEEMLKQADLALYRAKEEGRNGYRFFVEDMNTEIQQRMALGQDLHSALEHDELFLEYQPQVDLRSRRLVGVEALVRWRHPVRGVVAPLDFVPIAEANGLIVPIGEWVLRTACRQAKTWQRDGLAPIPVAVNLSAAQLRNRTFVESVKEILRETGLAPRFLELELTESVLMAATPVIEESIATLSELGVRISLDDFGKGYSSLEYLRRFPLNKLKIDQSFIHDIANNTRDATILRSVVALAAQLGLDVVAEGLGLTSNPQQLLDEGCGEGQGFFFSEPQPPAAVARLLAEGSSTIKTPVDVQ